MSGLLNSGKLSAIITDVTTLLSRVTAGVAVASTALSNAVWTNAKAAFLDVSISSRAAATALQTVDNELATVDANVDAIKADTDAYLDAKVSEAGAKAPSSLLDPMTSSGAGSVTSWDSNGLHSIVNVSSETGWLTQLDITAAGVIEFLGLEYSSATDNEDCGFRVTIDGTVVFSDTTVFTSSAQELAILSFIGLVSNGGISLAAVPFKTSFKVEIYQPVSTANEETTWYKYYLT